MRQGSDRIRSAAKVIILCSAFCSFLSVLSVEASSVLAGIYNRGNEAYEKGDYSKAEKYYLEAIQAGANNARVHYNLGNTYMRLDKPKLGLAIASYRRALSFAPRDTDVRYNLDVARAKVAVKPPRADEGLLSKTWKWAMGRIRLSEAGFAAGFSFLAVCISFAAGISLSNGFARKLSVTIIFPGIIVLILSGAGYYHAHGASKQVEGVIISDELSARSGPGEENNEAFKLSEGVEVKVKERRRDWFNIFIPGGLSGWVPSETVEII